MLINKIRLAGNMLFFFTALTLGYALPVHIIATGDMHGGLQPTKVADQLLGGTAEMLAYWRNNEGYRPENYLLLSCGDDVTSSMPIPMILQGDPVIEVMNDMGYDASAVGNHDFDFSPQRLADWCNLAKFPFLAANLGKVRDFPAESVKPYLIDESQGVKVAVIGIALPSSWLLGTPETLVSAPAEETVRRIVAEVRAQQVEVIIILSHLPFQELSILANRIKDLNVPLLLGGHDHEFSQRKIGNSWVINSGAYWYNYTRIDLDYNRAMGKSTLTMAKQITLQQDINNADADAQLQTKISTWQQQIDTDYNEIIGNSEAGLTITEIARLLTDSWLKGDDKAQIAITNAGSIREQLLPGTITMRRLLGILPFSYLVFRITLTGEQLLGYLSDKNFYSSGLQRQGAGYQLTNGKAIIAQSSYQLLVNSYIYDTSAQLQKIDPDPIIVFDDWRRPLIARLKMTVAE